MIHEYLREFFDPIQSTNSTLIPILQVEVTLALKDYHYHPICPPFQIDFIQDNLIIINSLNSYSSFTLESLKWKQVKQWQSKSKDSSSKWLYYLESNLLTLIFTYIMLNICYVIIHLSFVFFLLNSILIFDHL